MVTRPRVTREGPTGCLGQQLLVCAREAAGAWVPEQMLPGSRLQRPPPRRRLISGAHTPRFRGGTVRETGTLGRSVPGRCVNRRTGILRVLLVKGSENRTCRVAAPLAWRRAGRGLLLRSCLGPRSTRRPGASAGRRKARCPRPAAQPECPPPSPSAQPSSRCPCPGSLSLARKGCPDAGSPQAPGPAPGSPGSSAGPWPPLRSAAAGSRDASVNKHCSRW